MTLEKPSNERLLEIACDKVLGFTEIIDWLQDEGPATPDQLLRKSIDRLQVRWTTPAQINWRLGWLKILGVLVEKNGKWSVVLGSSDEDGA